GTTAYEQEVDMQNQIATTIENKIQQSLIGMFNPKKFRVMANVTVDFNEVSKKIKDFGDKGTVRSQEKNKDSSNAAGEGQDEAGAASNEKVPNYDADDKNKNTTYKQD